MPKSTKLQSKTRPSRSAPAKGKPDSAPKKASAAKSAPSKNAARGSKPVKAAQAAPAKKSAATSAPAKAATKSEPVKAATQSAKAPPSANAAPHSAKIAAAKPAITKPAAASAAPAKSSKPAPNAPSTAVMSRPATAPAATTAQTTEHPAQPAAPATSTFFVLLSAHERRGRRFVQLKSPTVLAWFQRAFRNAQAGKSWGIELQGEVYGLDALFDTVVSKKLAIPTNELELQALLKKHIYFERDMEAEGHFVHVETNDDEVDIEYFFFDDAFLATDEALDRLPSPQRRPRAIDGESEEEEVVEDDDDDPYTQLISRLTDD